MARTDSDSPKVALVHDHLVQDGGAERLLRVLMAAYPQAPVYTAFYDRAMMGPEWRDRDIRTSWLQRIPGGVRHYKALLPLLDRAFRSFDLSKYDVVISSASGFAKSVRTGSQTLHICYCHTPIRYLWSDSDFYVASLGYPAPVKWLIKLIRPRLRSRDLRAARQVDAFIANSQHVAARIRRYYDRDSVVIYPPVDVSQFAPAKTPGNYCLVAGRLVAYKRFDLAIQAANQLQVPLQVMGSGVDESRLRQLAGPTVEFVGRVSDARRRTLMARAQAMINPQEEDFGITTVEALASGTPVIAYGVGGAAEILDETTGQLFSPQTAEALARVMASFDRSRFRRADLTRRARDFSAARFTRQVRRYVATLHDQR